MFKSARVFWKVYYKDRLEQGSSRFFDNFKDLKNELNLLRLWQRSKPCHIDIDVTFYPENIFLDTVTIMGAL